MKQKLTLVSDSETIRYPNANGILKSWILKDKCSDLIGDVLQKINYSISDLNEEIKTYTPSAKNVVYQIVLSMWILEGAESLLSIFRDDVVKNFTYDNQNYDEASKYIKALRSFVVAHPLNTNRHKKYGFDGDFVCTDIYTNKKSALAFVKEDRLFKIDLEGVNNCNPENCDSDYFLKVYSKRKDNSNFYEIISCSFRDLYSSVNCLIDYIDALDKYLQKTKKRDFDCYKE